MPQNADDLNLLYIFTGSFFLMFAYMLRSGWDGSLRGWGNRMDLEGVRALATTGVYELPERHAWDTPWSSTRVMRSTSRAGGGTQCTRCRANVASASATGPSSPRARFGGPTT